MAESFGDLDPMMDAREADLEPGQKWTGWHLIEKDLWPPAPRATTPLTATQRTTYAEDLLANTETLDERIQELEYTLDQIANGSRGLLEEVATGKVTGEEEYWSRTDLWDFQANVDGARVAYEGVQPILEANDPELAETLTTRVRRAAGAAGRAARRRGLRVLRRADPRPGQGVLRRGQRAVRAVVAADRGGAGLSPERNVSRRGLLGGAGAAVAGAAAAGVAVGRLTDDPAAHAARPAAYPFHGEHQAGITTPVQDRLHFAAFDVTTESRDELVALLRAWTDAAARMTQGEPAGPVGPTEGADNLPPDDTGEAIGLSASGLTLTFGFGPSLFADADGRDRFGLASRRPAALEPLPHFPGDVVDPALSGRRPVRASLC